MGAPADLHDRICRIFSGSLSLDIPAIDTDLFETGVLDSLAFVELLLRLEQEFGVTATVDDLDVENFRTIERIAEFVSSRGTVVSAPPNEGRVVHLSARR